MKMIINPNEARKFGRFLDEQCRDLAARNAQVSKKLLELHVSWQDRKYDAFTKLFDEASVKLSNFLLRAEKFSAYLRAKSAIADKYLGK